jgi:putative transposase
MPAFARVALPGVPYHVTQRGNYRQEVFFRPEDRAVYLQFVTKSARLHGLELHGWCLMSNHVHWIVVPTDKKAMADSFRQAHSQYSVYINQAEKRKSGHLWQGRYYSCPLDNAHFGAALLYVERNPARAGLVRVACDYLWSSAAARVGLTPVPGFLRLEPWARQYSAGEWRSLLEGNANPEVEQRVRVSTQQGKPCGSEDFVTEMEGRVGRELKVRAVGRPRNRENTQKADGGSLNP